MEGFNYSNFGFVPSYAFFGHEGENDEDSPRIRGKYVQPYSFEGVAGAEQEKVFGSPNETDFFYRQENRKKPEKKIAAAQKLLEALGLPETEALKSVIRIYLNGGMSAVVESFFSRAYTRDPYETGNATISFAEKMRVYNPRIFSEVKEKLAKAAQKEIAEKRSMTSDLLPVEVNKRLAKKERNNIGPATRLYNILF